MNEETRSKRRNNNPKRQKGNGFFKPVFLGFLFIIFIFAVSLAFKIYMPNFSIINVHEFFNRDQNSIMLVVEDEIISGYSNPAVKEGEIYLPVDFVKDYMDKYIFWDEASKKLTITTEYKVMQMKTEELTYYVNMKPMELNLPVYEINETAYMPEGLLTELYNVGVKYDESNNIIIIDYLDRDLKSGSLIPKKSALRYNPDKKSPIERYIYEGESFYIYEEEELYYRIRTEDGLIGYVLKKDVSDIKEVPGTERPIEKPDYIQSPIEGKITLVWDLIEKAEQNSRESSRKYHEGLDVLSPTWFRFDRESYNGDILSIADNSYVTWAHNNGYQVWALMSDEEDGEVTAQILSSTEKREHVIKQILAFCSLYKLDGINIDFERVREADVQYFHQFLRELWPLLREQGVVLSVDTFVPRAWSMYYNRGEIANSSDYICVMTYDENTYGGTSGPNASIPFVEDGVVQSLKEVPKEKLIMGVPFYSRVWMEEETDTGINYKIRNLGMNYAYRMFTENGAEFQWLDDLGCYYGEFDTVEDGKKVKYRTWLEDEKSMERKLELVEKYDLAGVSAWVRGLEKEEIWSLLDSKLNK